MNKSKQSGIIAVDVYLERKKTRQYTGRLTKKNKKFIFEYSEAYLRQKYPLALGPDLPAGQIKHASLKLFPSFEDRIPSKRNPAYKEYCQWTGISPNETNPLVLIAALGQKGPSSFVCTPVFKPQPFKAEDLKNFRAGLKLSIREFALVFEVSSAAVYRIENQKTSGLRVLKHIEIYAKNPAIALQQINKTGITINEAKKTFIKKTLRRRLETDKTT